MKQMKVFIIIVLGLLFVSPSFASKARLQALGQSENGSPYIDDFRGIFRNPAFFQKQGDFANFELGSDTVTTTPNAEGGLFRVIGDQKFGIQLGKKAEATSLITDINTILSTALPSPHNTVNAVLSGGTKSNGWGASLLYGTMVDNQDLTTPGTPAYPNKKANTIELKGGLLRDEWEGYAHLQLISHSENETASGQTAKFDTKPSITVGGSVPMANDQKVFGTFTYGGLTARAATATQDREGSLLGVSAGWVQFFNPEASTRFFYSGGFTLSNFKLTNPGTTDYTLEVVYLPIILGMESKMADWFTLRASISQNVLLDQKKTSVTDQHTPNSTKVAVGTGFNWKKLQIDGTLAGSSGGVINTTNMLANVSLNYFF